MNWNETKTNTLAWIKRYPVESLMIAIVTATAGAKMIEANTNRQNAKTWRKEVERRSMMGTK